MSIESLKAAKQRTIGSKQTAKAIEKGTARLVFVAKDADEFVTRDIIRACRERQVELIFVDSMAALGNACGIEVGAATAAIVDP